METFIVERNVSVEREGDGNSAETIACHAQQLTTTDGTIQWLQTVITESKIYSLYKATSAERLRRAAIRKQYAIHRLLKVTNKQVGTDITERSMNNEN